MCGGGGGGGGGAIVFVVCLGKIPGFGYARKKNIGSKGELKNNLA